MNHLLQFLANSVKVLTIRNGSAGDAIRTEDVARITRALEELGLAGSETMIAVDDGSPAFPWRHRA